MKLSSSEKIVFKEESYKIIGACFEIYNEMGSGFAEAVYQECLEIERLIQEGIATAGSRYAEPQSLSQATVDQLEKVIAGLRSVPVEVEIKVVPVQDDGDSIESLEGSKPVVAIKPSVEQG